MAWFELLVQEEEKQPSGGILRSFDVTLTVTGAAGLPRELFVVRVDGGAFCNVATPFDLQDYGTNQVMAADRRDDFYRVPTVTRSFLRRADALAFRDHAKSRLRRLVNSCAETAAAPFGGTDTVVYASD